MARPIDRRDFIRTSAASAGLLILPGSYLHGTQDDPAPSQKLNIACVGAGGRGEAAVNALHKDHNLIALCDVDLERAANSFKRCPDAKQYQDYRKMFDELGDQIDAVTVSTPDHMHFPIAMAAIERGKHVFCEKPLTHSIWEARQMRLAATAKGVQTQMGNHGHANEGTRLMREWVQAGAIGSVREVHHWTDRPIWPQGIGRPTKDGKAPSHLDWDLWLGVAPERPYADGYAPFNWRGWWDFGTGALGDMGCHIMDSAFWALDLGSPTSVEAISTPVNKETAPKASKVTFEFPARGEMPPVRVHWYDGGLRPSIPASLEADREWESNGTLVVGDDGALLANTYCSSVRMVPEAKMKEFLPNRPEKTIPRIKGGHFKEWTRAIQGDGPKAGSNFDYSGPLTEAVLLGNLAIRSGRRLNWDGEALRVTNFEPANAYVRRPYREGFGV